jgi:hypothetical protein
MTFAQGIFYREPAEQTPFRVLGFSYIKILFTVMLQYSVYENNRFLIDRKFFFKNNFEIKFI